MSVTEGLYGDLPYSSRASFGSSSSASSSLSGSSTKGHKTYSSYSNAPAPASPATLRWRDVNVDSKRRRRSSRSQVCGSLGWLVALICLYFIARPFLSTNSIPKLQHLIYGRPSTSNETAVAVPAVSGVTIVSAFFLVRDGKKHAIDGEHEFTATASSLKLLL